jgi:hypothetical protein
VRLPAGDVARPGGRPPAIGLLRSAALEPDLDPESWLLYFAMGALHLAGRHDTTEATRRASRWASRWASRYMDRPFTILGVTS